MNFLDARVEATHGDGLRLSLDQGRATLDAAVAALDIVAANAGNQVVADALVGAQDGVREGKNLSAILAQYPVMPIMLTQMIETGEESGGLDDMLDKVSTFYDNEVNATVDSLTSILEPLIILFMGACIGAIVISLYLPMFDYVKLLQQPEPKARSHGGNSRRPCFKPVLLEAQEVLPDCRCKIVCTWNRGLTSIHGSPLRLRSNSSEGYPA